MQAFSGTVTLALTLVGIAIVTGSIAGTIAGTVAAIIGGAAAELSDTHHYFMALSNRRVFLVEASALGRPTKLKAMDLRSSVTIASVTSGILWNRFSYYRSGASPEIMHFNRRWSADVRSIIHVMAECPDEGIPPESPPADTVIVPNARGFDFRYLAAGLALVAAALALCLLSRRQSRSAGTH